MKFTIDKQTTEINNIEELINFYKRYPNDTANIVKEMSSADFLKIVTFSDEFQRAVKEMPNCADALVQKALNNDEVFRMVTITPYMTYKLIDSIPAIYANRILDRLATDTDHFDRLYYDENNADVYDLLRTLAKLPDVIADKFVQRIFNDSKIYNMVYANIMPIIHEAYSFRPHLSDQLIEKILDNENEFYRLMDGNEYTLKMLADHFPRYPVLKLSLAEVIPAWKEEKSNRNHNQAVVPERTDPKSYLNNASKSPHLNFNMFANVNDKNLASHIQHKGNDHLAETKEIPCAKLAKG